MTSATNRAAGEIPEPPVRPHLTLLDGRGQVVWQEAPAAPDAPGPFGYTDRVGQSWHLL